MRSFNGGKLFTILTDSTLTRTIALNEVEDVAQSLDWSLRLLVIPLSLSRVRRSRSMLYSRAGLLLKHKVEIASPLFQWSLPLILSKR
ncbi:MAG: hypothetical protein ACK5RE_08930 [Pseudanabaena sp.]